jgi:hypothetical protein
MSELPTSHPMNVREALYDWIYLPAKN